MQTKLLGIGNNKAFTLIEIIIVMVIIGIVASFISISFKLDRSQQLNLNELTYRINNSLLIAHDNAVMQAQAYSVSIDRNTYQLYRLIRDNNGNYQWEPSMQPKAFSHFIFPENFYAKFTLKNSLGYMISEFQPDVIFFPNGEITPFELVIFVETINGTKTMIKGYKNGEIKTIGEG